MENDFGEHIYVEMYMKAYDFVSIKNNKWVSSPML